MVYMHTLYTTSDCIYLDASTGNSLITTVNITYLQIKLSMFILHSVPTIEHKKLIYNNIIIMKIEVYNRVRNIISDVEILDY